MYAVINGRISTKADISIPLTNRSFRYGDGLFESIRMAGARLPFLATHLERLFKGMALLQLQAPFDGHTVEDQIMELAVANRIGGEARIRITVYREGTGFYSPDTLEAGYLIEADPLKGKGFDMTDKGLHIDIFKDHLKPVNALSALKTNNSMLFVLASIWKDQQKLDDALILNANGRIAEATSSNVFLYLHEKLITPPVSEGCVEGVMRREIIQLAMHTGIPVEESPVQTGELTQAREIWLTNAIQGIQWVEKCQNHRGSNHLARELSYHLNNYI